MKRFSFAFVFVAMIFAQEASAMRLLTILVVSAAMVAPAAAQSATTLRKLVALVQLAGAVATTVVIAANAELVDQELAKQELPQSEIQK